MRRRPWPILVLALVQLLAPVVSLCFSAWMAKISPLLLFNGLMKYGTWSGNFETFGLPILAGFSIFAMRRWSYALFLGILFWNGYQNFHTWQETQDIYGITGLVAVQLINL